MRARRSTPRRKGLFRAAAAALAFLATCHDAAAGNVLRRAGAGAPGAPGPSPAAAASTAAAQAAAAASRAENPLRRALEAIRAYQAAQDAARAAALDVPDPGPNGLGSGALDPAGDWQAAILQGETVQDGRRAVTITQTDGRAILTWNTFNVGRHTDLTFDQSAGGPDASSWVALNRVIDPSGAPSRILGSIRAQGQIYVINRNGVIFGGTSQVGVGSLLVSGLDIAPSLGTPDGDRRFLIEPLTGLSFAADGTPPPGALPYGVVVESGGRISVGARGRVVLLGDTVSNAGTLEAPDGQVFMAAGRRIQLGAPAQADLSAVRGLSPPAEPVTTDTSLILATPLVEPGGFVANTGVVSARRGNVTMLGRQTIQAGLVTVTNGAEANGSIHLGTVGGADNVATVFTTSLAAGSVTQALPDLEETKTVLGAGDVYRSSLVRVYGDRIDVRSDATLYAPSGDVAFRAVMTAQKPAGTSDPTLLDDTRIYLEPGARIDVSGLRDVEVAMERNAIKAELRANELRDNPVARSGPLRGRTVYFDERLGAKLEGGSGVADLSGYYDLLERPVSELMTAGGKIDLFANQIIARQGSVLDVSGGSVRHRDGLVRRTVLVDAAGRRVPIEDASAGVTYLGLEGDFVVAHPRWGVVETYSGGLARYAPRFERGYLEGRSAGTVRLGTALTAWSAAERLASADSPEGKAANPSATGAVRILDGSLVATTVIGPYQRERPTGSTDRAVSWREAPRRGALLLENAGDVSFSAGGPILGAGFGIDGAVDPAQHPYFQHTLPASWFGGGGAGTLSIASGYDPNDSSAGPGTVNRAPGGHLVVAQGTVVDLGDHGSLSFTGKSARIDGALIAPGGTISLAAVNKEAPASPWVLPPPDGSRPGTVELGAGGVIDVAGRWTNEALDGLLQPRRPLDGGSVSLSGGAVLLDAGSRVDVSGGGRLDASATRVTSGAAGAITVDATRYPQPSGYGALSPPPEPYAGMLVLDGVLDGHALGTGGSLTLRAGGAMVIGDAHDPSAGLLGADFFTHGGFASYTVVGERGVRVSGGLAPAVESYAVPDHPSELPTGTRLADVAAYQTVRDASGLALPMTLGLSTGSTAYSSAELRQEVSVDAGVSIRMAPGSTVALSSLGAVRVDGAIEAPGGVIRLLNPNGSPGAGGIEIGGNAVLSVRGYTRAERSAADVVRSVRPGGSIVLAATADASASAHGVMVEDGAVLDASGVAGFADLPAADADPRAGGRYRQVAVQGDAGSISINATEGVIAGELRLGPGVDPAVPAVARGSGGALSIAVSGGSTQNVVVVSQQVVPGAAAGGGVLRVAASRIDDSGADEVTIQVPGLTGGGSFPEGSAVLFDGDVTLTSGRSLTLVAPNVGTWLDASAPAQSTVTLRSGYVSVVGGPSSTPIHSGADDLRSSLRVEADLIDVARTVVLGCARNPASGQCVGAYGGFGTATLDARAGDVRLSNHDPAGRDAGAESPFPGLLSPGAIELRGAQVYVVSRGRARLLDQLERDGGDPGFLVESGTRITVSSPDGALPPVPMSYGERLTLRAPTIEQGGVLRAPAGQIRLEGQGPDGSPSGAVTLLPGSTTSVSLVEADGTGAVVAFGAVQSGGIFYGYHQPGQAPALSVTIGGARVRVEPGATLDVRGGGDLLGFTFTPGNGGSDDVLGSVTDAKGNLLGVPSLGSGLAAPFAVVPGLKGPAPVGPVDALRDARLQVGDQVWLEVPGLAPGPYTLLPAHYALLPGGLLVQPLGGELATAPPGFVRADGAFVTSGHRMVNGVRSDAGYGRWAVMTKDVFGAYGALSLSSFDAFAHRTAADAGAFVRTPNDAGTAALTATEELVLQGTGRFGAGPGGLLGNLDVSAPRIAVAGAERAGSYGGYVVLDPRSLEDFGAGSVLLGGTRSPSRSANEPGTLVRVTASEVVVDTAGVDWSGPEILFAATGLVSVADGSSIQAHGASSSDPNALRVTGDGALLRLTTGDRVDVLRSGAAAGALIVGNARLAADGALAFDTGGAFTLASGAALSAPKVDLASTRMHLGDAPQGVGGTVVGRELVERLAASSGLVIRGSESIRLYGGLSLGSRGPSAAGAALTLDTPLLEGEAGATARIAVDTLVLRNLGAAYSGAAASGAGALELEVGSLVLGPGQVQIAGFGRLAGSAGTTSVRGGGALAIAGSIGWADRPFATDRIVAASGVSYELSAGGDAFLGRGAGSADLAAADSLGGRVTLRAASILLDTEVTLPAGTFEAKAAGALTVGPHAVVDVSGRALDFGDVVRHAPGGRIRLAAAGALTAAPGAVLDVSGSSRGGDGGSIELSAPGGPASISGALRGSAGAGHRGAAFSLDAGSVSSFAALNQLLEAGGFTDAREIRLRDPGQDLALAEGDRISAHDVTLRSDGGHVTVAGAIGLEGDASHAAGGRIELAGGAGVSLEATASIDARAAAAESGGYTPASGRVIVSAGGGAVDVRGGARIDVSGGREGGSIVVRVPRPAIGDVRLEGRFVGAAQQVLQGVQVYEASIVDAAWLAANPMVDQAAAWLAAAKASHPGGVGGFELAPAMVVRSAGSLSVTADLSLARPDGAGAPAPGGAGYLGFAAGGDLSVGAAVSDGFESPSRPARLLEGRSYSLGLEAGGSVVLGAGALVRTGTGDIVVRAGGDLRLDDPAAVLYTAGTKTPWASGFQNQGGPIGAVLGEFPTQGGDIDLLAAGSIVAPLVSQTTSAWLFRYGRTSWGGDVERSTVAEQASWSIVHANFGQGVAALGGGDVRVRAGQDVTRLQVAIPTSGQVVTPVGSTPRDGDLVLRGGGDLLLSAGRDIRGGLFVLGRGSADLRAGGGVIPDEEQKAAVRYGWSSLGVRTPARAIGVLLGLADATARITAGAAATIEGVFDPMKQAQIAQNLVADGGMSGTGSAFQGYEARTALEVTAVGGAVAYLADPWASVDVSLASSTPTAFQVQMSGGSGLNALFGAAPPTLELASLASDAAIDTGFTAPPSELRVAPAPRGTIELVARRNVRLALDLSMEDTSPSYVRGWRAPLTTVAGSGGSIAADASLDATATNSGKGFTPIHLGDPDPVRIYALEGSFCAQARGSCVRQAPPVQSSFSTITRLTLPKPLHLVAGRDVLGGEYELQGNAPGDLSLVSAGRDLYQPVLEFLGQGSAIVEAGRDVILGEPSVSSTRPVEPPLSGGALLSLGNTSLSGTINAALRSDRGVNVYVLAGVKAGRVDYDGFAAAYLDPANAAQRAVHDYLGELRQFMAGIDGAYLGLGDAELVAAFRALPRARREPFLLKVYFTELKETGIDHNDPDSVRYQSYARGFRAVSTLFPVDPSSLAQAERGNVILHGKRVETWSGGALTMVAPYGRVEVGTDLLQRGVDSSKGGMVTRRGGDIRIMADENIDLFTSRVFTLQGGDITMWTTNGSITAGSGSKTSVFQRPLSYTMTRDGVVEVDAFGLQTGAGIGVLDALDDADDRPPSRLDLIAPRGEVNAGDAGIRVVGNLNIAAAVVVGMDNIQVSGVSQGLPTIVAPSVGALTAASQAVQAAAKDAGAAEGEPRTKVEDLPSIITVEVVGYEATDEGGDEQPRKKKK